MMGLNPSERRNFIRLPSNIPVHYSLSDTEQERERAFSFLKNISVGGMLFDSEDSIPEGSKFRFSISLPSSVMPLKGIAEAVWIVKKEGVREVGSRFLEIDKDAREMLISYVEYELQKIVMEESLVPEPLKETEIQKPCGREATIIFMREMEKNILALKSLLEKDNDEKDRSGYLPLQANIARNAGAFLDILGESPLFMPCVCFVNRITYILAQMGCWRNFKVLTS